MLYHTGDLQRVWTWHHAGLKVKGQQFNQPVKEFSIALWMTSTSPLDIALLSIETVKATLTCPSIILPSCTLLNAQGVSVHAQYWNSTTHLCMQLWKADDIRLPFLQLRLKASISSVTQQLLSTSKQEGKATFFLRTPSTPYYYSPSQEKGNLKKS